MDLSKLFPNSKQKKVEDDYLNVMYLSMCEWGWSYDQFLNTPFVVVMTLMKKDAEIKRKRNKKK